MNWEADKAAIMLFVALGEICQLYDKLHLIHCSITDKHRIEGCVLLPFDGWPREKICEDSRVMDFITKHAIVLRYECLLNYLLNCGKCNIRLPLLLTLRDYIQAEKYANIILDAMDSGTRAEFENWHKSATFYYRPEIRLSLEYEPGPRSCLKLQSRMDSQLDYFDSLEFALTSSRIENLEEAREIIVMHLSQIRPFAVRYLSHNGLSFLRHQEAIIAQALANGKKA